MTDSDNVYYNPEDNQRRYIAEFTGLCKGIIADKEVADLEIVCLINWLYANPLAKKAFPIDKVAAILENVDPQNITEKDREKLFNVLKQLVENELLTVHASALPLDNPPPKHIEPFDKTFCLIGKFNFGHPKEVEELLMAKGAIIQDSINKKLDYLVIGDLTNPDWKHSSYAKKIEKALELKKKSTSPAIISEATIIKFI